MLLPRILIIWHFDVIRENYLEAGNNERAPTPEDDMLHAISLNKWLIAEADSTVRDS